MLRTYWKNPYRIFMLLGDRGLLNWLPDKPYLRLIFRANVGMKLDLENPQTFNQKLNWLKLYDRQPLYTRLSDKYAVRSIIAERIGEAYLVPLLGVWDDPEAIDFDALPDRFVLKTTHDSGGVLLCADRTAFDERAAREFLADRLRRRYWRLGRERQYEHIVPRVIAEAYLDQGGGEPPNDYKVFCFHGKARCVLCGTDRMRGHELKITYFDMKWNRLPLTREHPVDPRDIPKPAHFDDMVRLAEAMASGLLFARIDFYEVEGRVYAGEVTLHPGSGLAPFEPVDWDYVLGGWLTLPERPSGSTA